MNMWEENLTIVTASVMIVLEQISSPCTHAGDSPVLQLNFILICLQLQYNPTACKIIFGIFVVSAHFNASDTS